MENNIFSLWQKIMGDRVAKGVKIVDNPFTLGSDVVDMKTGKVLHSGDSISCQVFVNNLPSPPKQTT